MLVHPATGRGEAIIISNMIVPSSTSGIRHELPDQLRGFALLGIILVNMPFLALTNGGLGVTPRETPFDTIVAFLIVALAQGKFYLLFSFLFGYSLTLILRDNSSDGLNRYRRRLVGLAFLGLLHIVFFFIGDILFSYAILGVSLLWFVKRSTRVVLICSAIAYGLGVLLLVGLVVLSIGMDSSEGGFISNPGALDVALRGGFLDATQGRLAVLAEALIFQALVNWMPALAMFLLGFAAGRRGVLARPEDFRRLWLWLIAVAVLVGLPAGIVSAWLGTVADDPSGFVGVLSVAVGFAFAPALTGGYVAVVALATNTTLMSLFSPVGRMSLTGYLGESILMSAVFCGWGLGLFGELTIAQAALVALIVWLSLDLFAHLWLRRFTYGPFEWLLRSWTYARLVKLRRPSGNQEIRQH